MATPNPLLSPEETDALFDTIYEARKNADGEDAKLYERLADKLDELLMSYGLICSHLDGAKHKTDAEPDQVELADYCEDCDTDYDCEGHEDTE
jgi:hypothetical protein